MSEPINPRPGSGAPVPEDDNLGRDYHGQRRNALVPGDRVSFTRDTVFHKHKMAESVVAKPSHPTEKMRQAAAAAAKIRSIIKDNPDPAARQAALKEFMDKAPEDQKPLVETIIKAFLSSERGAGAAPAASSGPTPPESSSSAKKD